MSLPTAKPTVSFDFSYDVREMFTNGLCYCLAYQLAKQLDGTLVVMVVHSKSRSGDVHGMCKVGDKYIDIEGVWTKEDAETFWYQWSVWQTDGATLLDRYEIVEKEYSGECLDKNDEVSMEYAYEIVKRMKDL